MGEISERLNCAFDDSSVCYSHVHRAEKEHLAHQHVYVCIEMVSEVHAQVQWW